MAKAKPTKKRARKLPADTKKLLQVIQNALLEKKAQDTVALDVGMIASLADVFVVTTGNSTRHIDTLVDYICELAKLQGMRPFGVEGLGTGWALVDFGDVVVHVFDEQTRSYYDIERLWFDAPTITLPKPIPVGLP